jgi:hypothetical protein
MDSRTIEALIELKTEGHRSIYFLDVRGLEILFRPLTFSEYDTVMDIETYLDAVSVNDAILRMAVLYSNAPKGIAEWIKTCKRAFDIDHIAQKILDVSGYQNRDKFIQLLAEKRKKAQEVQSLIEIYICTAFKTISSKDILNMTLEEQLEYFAKAEEALGKPVDFNAIFNPPAKKGRMPNIPRREGMQSSTDDLLSPRVAEKPDFRNA